MTPARRKRGAAPPQPGSVFPWRPLLAVGIFFVLLLGIIGEMVRDAWLGPESTTGSLLVRIALLALTAAFTMLAMLLIVRRQLEAAEASRAMMRRLADSNIVGIAVAESTGRIVEANDAFLWLVGRSRAELDAGRVTWSRDGSGRPPLLDDSMLDEIRDHPVTPPRELAFMRANGSRVPVIAGFARLPNGSRFIAFVLDITERKRSEQALADRAQQLARSNQDLEMFAYVASHDLQEPLRMVASYVQLLERRYKGRLDADADEYIHYAADGARRMQALIQDLLTFSRVGTRHRPMQKCSAESALQRALVNLGPAILDSRALVVHEPLPEVMGDADQLTQVFQNLVSNGIKFTPAERRPRVQISAQRSKDEWVFAVRDNGIGIAPEYRDRVFIIFQRLHAREDFPGTGIGLSICKKIIERHGGRIWFEAAPDAGTIFRFTLPAVTEEDERREAPRVAATETPEAEQRQMIAHRARRLV